MRATTSLVPQGEHLLAKIERTKNQQLTVITGICHELLLIASNTTFNAVRIALASNSSGLLVDTKFGTGVGPLLRSEL
jgi:hypothetical protein